jgi:Holliday junction resolvase-like predicted endonuclease
MTWRSPATLLALVALAVALTIWITLRVRRWRDRHRRQATSRRAQLGEQRARDWLEKHGFRILGEQESLMCRMQIDGVTTEYEVCVDFVVERAGQRAIVEVKTAGAANPAAPATRRQIFEYTTLYEADCVYMFDGDTSQLHEIAFERVPRVAVPSNRMRGWQVGFAIGVAMTALVAGAWYLATRG